MGIMSRIERLERRVAQPDGETSVCRKEECVEFGRAFDEAYSEPQGTFKIKHSPAACVAFHASLEKAYGGGSVETLNTIVG